MYIDILTLFPEMFAPLDASMIQRARERDLVRIQVTNIRDFAVDKHQITDDRLYGGGAGMVMKPQPVYDAYKSLNVDKARVIYMTPQGKPFNQDIAKELSIEENIIIICGHYEGIDERVIEEIVTDEISMGDFVLTGGELAAMAVIDAVARLKPGVLGKEESFMDESFSDGLLEYPQYTRPPEFMGRTVPPVLLSGDHAKVDKWRHEQSLIRTYNKRPDILEGIELSRKDADFLKSYIIENSTDTNIE